MLRRDVLIVKNKDTLPTLIKKQLYAIIVLKYVTIIIIVLYSHLNVESIKEITNQKIIKEILL